SAHEAMRKAELERAGVAFAKLSPPERELVDRITKAIVAKVAHEPIAALKEGALEPEALRRAFGLTEAAASITAPTLPLDDGDEIATDEKKPGISLVPPPPKASSGSSSSD